MPSMRYANLDGPQGRLRRVFISERSLLVDASESGVCIVTEIAVEKEYYYRGKSGTIPRDGRSVTFRWS